MFIKDSVLKSLLALLTVFIIGYISVVSIHFTFANIIESLDEKVKNEQARYQIGEYILAEINSIEKQYYQMTMSFHPRQLPPLRMEITKDIEAINKAIDILEHGGTLKKYIELNMVGVHESVEYITFTPDKQKEYTFESIDLKPKLLLLREKLKEMENITKLKAKIQKMESLEKRLQERFKVKLFYKELPSSFIRMKENASRLLYESKQALQKHQNTIKEEKKKYHKLEIGTTIVVFFLTLVFGYLVIKQILTKSRELEKLTKQAKESEQNATLANETKSRFLANMSHEIRTPLNAIIGFSEILSKSKTLEQKDKDKANIIVKSSKALLLIINDILDISKVESGKLELNFEQTDLHNTLNNIVELYEINAKQKNITLKFKIDPELPKVVTCDETRLKQVLSNILSNAIKFTKEKGEVILRVKLLDLKENKALMRFSIQDEGIGISKENQKKIFDPFTQADSGISREFGGTGLGLSISMKIINLMDSKIKLTSQENIGSTFYFDLLLEYFDTQEFETSQIETTYTETPDSYKFNGNILVAEDNTNNQLLIQHLLEEYGLQVSIANNGKEAVELYKKNSYNLVFLDINMPIMDGLTALSHIIEIEKNRDKSVPKVALTANSLKGDRERYIEKGMNDYLSKPINSKKLQELLNKYFNSTEEKLQKKIKEVITINKNSQSICVNSFSKQYGVSESTALLMIENIKKNMVQEINKIEQAIEEQDTQALITNITLLKDNCINLSLEILSNLLQNLIDIEDLNTINKEFQQIKIHIKKLL